MMNDRPERSFDWNDTIENDSSFVLLPAGDYDFTVTKFERARHQPGPNSKLPPCNKAVLTLEVTDGQRDPQPVFAQPVRGDAVRVFHRHRAAQARRAAAHGLVKGAGCSRPVQGGRAGLDRPGRPDHAEQRDQALLRAVRPCRAERCRPRRRLHAGAVLSQRRAVKEGAEGPEP